MNDTPYETIFPNIVLIFSEFDKIFLTAIKIFNSLNEIQFHTTIQNFQPPLLILYIILLKKSTVNDKK